MIRTRTGYWQRRARAASAVKPKRRQKTYNPVPLDWDGTKKQYKEHQKDKAQDFLNKLTEHILAQNQKG